MLNEILWLLFIFGCVLSVIVVALREKSARKKMGQKLANAAPTASDPAAPNDSFGGDFAQESMDFDENAFK